MIKKFREQVKARHLRKKGLSLNEIVQNLKVSKSSVSVWVRDIKLTKSQLRFLTHKAHLKEIIQKRVATRLKNERKRRQIIIDNHKKTIRKIKISSSNLTVLGSALYWAEGGKSDKNRSFAFYNSDPEMIKIMMLFLKKICRIPNDKFRGHIHLHPHLDLIKAEKYWSNVSKIPISQLYKTHLIQTKSSRNTRDTLPFGTFAIQICSTDLYLQMLAWIEVIKEKVLYKYNR